MKIFGLAPVLIGMAMANMQKWNQKTCRFRPNHIARAAPNCEFDLNFHGMSQPHFECMFRNEFWDDDTVSSCNGKDRVNWVVMDIRTQDEIDSAGFDWPTKDSFNNRIVVSHADTTLKTLTCQNPSVCSENKIKSLFDALSGQFAASDDNACAMHARTVKVFNQQGYNGFGFMQFYNGLASGASNFGLVMACGNEAAVDCEDMAKRAHGYFERRHGADINIRIATDFHGLAAKLQTAALAADGENSMCHRSWRLHSHGHY